MERRSFGNTDLTVSIIGLGCYGMSGAYGPADDAESIATNRRVRESDNTHPRSEPRRDRWLHRADPV